MDVWHKVMKFLDHERGKVIGLAIALIIGFSIVGCDLKIGNPYDSQGEKVTATEFRLLAAKTDANLRLRLAEYEAVGVALQAEVAAFEENTQAGEDEFVERQEFQAKIINFAGGLLTTFVTGGTVNAAGVVASIISLAAVGTGIGAIHDKRNGNRVIADLKAKSPT